MSQLERRGFEKDTVQMPSDQSINDVLPNDFFRSNKAVMHSTYSNTRQVDSEMVSVDFR